MKQALDFIKAHTVALACGVVALLAIIAYFVYPVPSYFESLHAEVSGRKATYDTLTGLASKPRTLPAIDPTTPEPKPLDVFPTRKVIQQGRDAVKLLDTAAKNVLKEALRINQQPLLVADVLPRPTPLARNQFFDAYQIETAQVGDNADKGIIRRVLHGTLPPTQEELNALEASKTNEIYKLTLQTNSKGDPQNQPQVDAAVAEMKSKLPLEQRLDRAQRFAIYVSPGAVEINPSMVSRANLDATAIFNAQFSLWLQTTIFQAIADANNGSKSVLDSPIKHLVALRVPMSITDPSLGAASSGFGAPPVEGAAAVPELKPDATVALTPSYATDPLGYTHNAMYDPIRVDLVLRIDAARLPEALAAIARNHFVKVRNVNFRTVDAGTALAQGYFYSRDGATPLVEVTLECDVLMLREWLARYMPDPVKTTFAQLANPATPAQ